MVEYGLVDSKLDNDCDGVGLVQIYPAYLLFEIIQFNIIIWQNTELKKRHKKLQHFSEHNFVTWNP